jgi:predicted nuclease of restriction endonuclease-like RecB superfamily
VTRNKFETKIYKQLKKSKVPFQYEAEKIPYVLAGHYIPDFIIHTSLGKIYIEAKGYFRPEAKRKMAAVKRQHPELDIRLIFYSRSKTNIRFAERYGFKYAIGTIPQEWLDE